MVGVTGAIIGAGVLGAGASLIGGGMAASASRDAAQQSAEVQRHMYDTTREDYAPYREVGTSALRKLAGMYGVGYSGSAGTTDWGKYINSQPDVAYDYTLHSEMTPDEFGPSHYARDGSRRDLSPYTTGATPASAGFAGDYGGFQESPGYKFRRDEGLKAVERSASSRGLLGSGGTLKAIQRYGEGLASSEYENYANRLASLAGVGQSATGSVAQAGQQSAQGQAQAFQQAGQARASAYQNVGQTIGGLAGDIGGAFAYGQGMGGGSPYGGKLGGIY